MDDNNVALCLSLNNMQSFMLNWETVSFLIYFPEPMRRGQNTTTISTEHKAREENRLK